MNEVEYYREAIAKMLSKIESLVFLHQIWIIVKRHTEKKGGAA